ncbi:GEVED domain-containing protein [Brevifollis gellanilyticus]|uniref:PA14 domain-containing protein n=1 Tax=Brevifollis gellanilyticus TaxID=748831 RepID=A0A512M4G3_9BACT|nr:GEVED domain-containing protein [Brevifollis gellanilyticus]GEP41637.1 hypothetical protein BGE01nite_09280 [Brevifollis gellanilyticus]
MFRLLRLFSLMVAALAACGEAYAQSTTMLDWQFGASTTFQMTPTTRHNNIVAGDPLFFAGNQMTTVPRYNTSGNSTQFVEYNNWPTTETSGWASATRTSLNPTLSGPTVWSRFSLGPNSQFTLTALAAQFTYQRPSSTSPNSVRACLTWFDGTTYKRRYSPVVTINAAASTTTWSSAVNVTIAGSGSAGDTLPTITAMSGKTYLLELQFFGGSSASNKINVDNVKLLADSAVTGSIGWMTAATLPAAQVSRPYFVRLQAGSGNVASYTYSLVSGSIPTGLSLSSGNILGTPTAAAGTYNFTIRATGSTTADRAFSLTIGATPASPTGSNLAYFTYDSDTTADAVQGPTTMSSTLSEVTWGFDTRNSVLKTSLYAEGTAAASGTPITLDRGASGEMRGFSGWEVGSNYTATRNSLLHITDPASTSTSWRFAVTPSANTASIPPTSYVTTGDPNVLQFSTTFRATAAGNLRAFKADMLRWMKDDMVNDGALGPRYARLYAYYTNNSGVVQRWTGSTVEITSIYYQAMQAANQPQFRTLWWDLSTLDTAINATTAKYGSREVSFEIYFYYDHGYDGYQSPVVLLDDVGLTGDMAAPTLSIGNLVWDDLDNDGVKDAGEGGLAGAQVELYSPGADNAIGGSGGNADTKIGSTLTTTATGAYSFTALDPGNYYVKVTPPATHFLTGGVPDSADDRSDNDNNGAQPGGRGTPLYSPIINLAVDAEPTNDGDTDNDTDFSVDFGVFRGLSVGNLVYIDSDKSSNFGAADTGVSGVTVQLFNSTNTLIANTTTTSSSSLTGFEVRQVKSSSQIRTYAQALAVFDGTAQTDFWIGSASKINYMNPGGTDGRFTTGNAAFPDGVDVNYAVRAIGTVTIPTTGAYSFGMTLDGGGRLRVNNQDVIVDESALHSSADRFGTITLNAGTYPIEMVYWGVSGGAVELYARSGTFSVWSTNFKQVGDTVNGGLAMSYTDNASGGRYLFDGISPGSYYVKIPASEFRSGRPLYGYKSILNGSPAYSAVDDDGVVGGADNGIDVPTPEATGVRTSTLQLAVGGEPVNSGGETGISGTSDDATDSDVDLTVDLGFLTEQESCYYVRIIDTDRDGIPLIQKLNGTTQSTNLVFGGSIAHIDRAQFAYDTRTQRLDMQYIFNQWSGKKVRGFYILLTDGPVPDADNRAAIMYVDVYDRMSPKVTVMKYQGPDGGQTSYFTPGQLLESSITHPDFCTITVNEAGAALTVSVSASMSSVNNGNLWTSYGIDPATWEGVSMGATTGIWGHFYDLASAPTYNTEGKLTSWPRNTPDSSWWNYMATYTSDAVATETPCSSSMTIGNMVFSDTNNDGNFDSGEGVDNVLLYLFAEGKNPLTDTPASAVLSTGGGQYAFTGLSAGRYFVHVPPSEFQTGGPLAGKVSIAGAGGDAVADDQVDENGVDAAFPAVSGISTGVITLTENGEPVDAGVELGANKTTDNAVDNNGDLTVDLSFRRATSITLSGLAWNDANNNGLFSTGNLLGIGDEDPISAIVVDLYTPGADGAIGGTGMNADTFVATTATNASGVYSFNITSPGKYYVRVTPSAAFPTTCTSVVTADNGVANDNNGSQPGGEYTSIYSPVITLMANAEPGSSGSTNVENTIDFGLRPAQKLTVGNLVFLDNNNNGRYDSGDAGAGGVRVQLFNNSNVLVQETTTTAQGQVAGWRLQQAKASVAVQTLTTAESVLAGTNRTSLWTGTTDFINYVTSTANNGVQDYGHEGNGKLLPNGSMENVVLQASGTLNIVSGDTYTFIINANDGARLKIDGSLLIKDDGVHASRDAAGSLVLAPGLHTIEFLGFENTGGGGFEVWAKRGALTAWDEGFRLVGDTADGGLQVTYSDTTPDIGRYRFNHVSPGSYYVKIPASEFSMGGVLEGRLSFVQTTTPTDDQKDDNSTTGSADSGVDSTTPFTNGIASHVFALSAGGEPTSTAEGGFYGTEDDAADSNGDMTIDFAFDGSKQVVAGAFHFNMKDLDQNANFSAVEEISPDQNWDYGYNNGNSGALFSITDWDMIFDSDKERLTMDVTFDQKNSKKVDSFWICVSPGGAPHSDNTAIIYVNGITRSSPKLTVYKHTASLEERSWQTTANCLISNAGTGINASDVMNLGVTETGTAVRFRFQLNTARLNNASNWAVVTNKPAWTGAKFYGRAGVCFHPMDNGTWTYDAAGRITALDAGWPNQGWLETDESGAYAIRTEVSPVLTVGDLIWDDANNNGTRDAGEAGIDGVAVELWFPGLNGTRENGAGDDSKVADAVSYNGGFYQFTDVPPGVYYVRIPTPPPAFPLASGVVTAADNSVNNDNNGSQTAGQGSQVVSPLITLTLGAEPSGTGSNEDTIDFGFRVIPTQDFGDWNGAGALTLTTSSTADINLRLGATVDAETNVTPNAAATVDDTTATGSSDDEDGVTMPASIQQATSATIPVAVYNNTGASAYLHAWIDFNNDGAFNNTLVTSGGERLEAARTIATGTSQTTQNITFTVPATASLGTERGVRFRLTNLMSTTATGVSGLGEVEDYVVTIACPTITVSPSSLAAAVVGTAYSQTMISTGGYGAITYSVSSGALPAWATLNGGTGVISGMPSSTASASFTIRATDANGCSGSRSYLLTPACPVIAITPATLPNATLGSAYSQTLTASGGTAAYSWTVSSGTLPAGLSLSSAGVLSGTPTATNGAGVSITFRAQDNYGCAGTLAMTVRVCPVITLNPGSLSGGMVGVAYSQTLTASGGLASYAYAVASGSLPAGLSLNASTGALTGTPTTPETQAFTMRATDANGCIGTTAYSVTILPNTDYGDFNGFGTASSIFNSTLKLGALAPDTELSTNTNATANGDDTTGTDDEDGVTHGTLRAGQSGTITVNVTNTSGAVAYLNVWADWDRDNNADSGEQIATNVSIANNTNGANQVLTVTPPVITAAGTLPLRARITSVTGAGLAGALGNGEVEDHLITITAPNIDFGDQSTFPQATSIANSNLKLGALAADAEAAMTANATANADDTNGTDDEDGVTQSTLRAGQGGTITVNLTNSSASAAYLNVWTDWNNNGVIDSGEQIATNTSIAAATSNSNQVLNVTPPVVTVTGTIPLRARLTNSTSPGFSNVFPGTTQGEVEDHSLTITAPDRDFGDWNGSGAATTTAFNTQDSNLRIGATFDAEATVTPDATATADDLAGSDEDGAAVPASMMQTVSTTIPVAVLNNTGSNAFLHAWIDFNNDGTFDNALLTSGGERLEPVRTITSGASSTMQNITFTVPVAASAGTARGVRVRLTNSSTTTPTTAGGIGEIEDYVTSIITAMDYGDYDGLASASSSMVSTLRIGALTDAETSNPANSTAGGDDSTGVDDEDGASVPASITAGSVGNSFNVTVTNTSGAPAFLSAWIDFNRNGVITDSGEQIASSVSIANGVTNSAQNVTFSVPPGASLGTAGVRVRLTSSSGAAPSGAVGNGEVEDYTTTIIAPVTDFGDDNDFADAFSTADTNLRLGATVDVEGASTRNSLASGDDTTGSDDEDAVTFPSLTAGQPVVLPVSVFNSTGSAGFLNAWIDFNNNGVLTDSGEQIAINQVVPTGTNGNVNVSFTVPTNAVTAAASIGTRFRVTSTSGAAATGGFGTGEVEDHQVVILAPLTDFGDHSGYVDVSNTASSNLRLGASVDTEYASTRNATATGDNITGNDDEDGVTIPAMIAGAPVSIGVSVTNTSGGQGYLNVWVDFNNNGLFTDSGEQVMSNGGVNNGVNGNTVSVSFTVPPAATTGVSTGVRARLTSDISPGVGGSGGVGEVEDYAVTIAAPTTDLGDFNLFADASSTVTSQVRLGALTDVEYAATKNAAATGDDTVGSDDEDGVTLPAMMAGAPATIPVIVTNTSGADVFLSAWIDFNNNGSLADIGEQIVSDAVVSPGTSSATQNLNVTIPATALTGVNVGVRVRLTSTSGAAPTGAAGNGEVEDYIVNIQAPTTDFGDFSGFADASQGANPALRMGDLLDTEFSSTRNATGSGDDTTGSDDEDGVVMPSMIAGQSVVIPVTITNGTGANGFLNAWIDWNNNGLITDGGEQVATNILIATGATNAVTNLNVTVPPGATTGVVLGARFRLSAPSGLGPTGSNALAGEIEDYAVTIAAPTTDFGDFSVFGSASSTRDSTLKIGALTDAEYLQTANTLATGDDTTGSDDEDGVAIPAMTAGAPVTLPVTVTNTSGSAAFLNAWIDYNNNGVLTDSGEQVASNVSIANGSSGATQNLSFTVPANAVTGINLGVRVRLTSTSGPGSTGLSGNGEVEDYIVNLAAPTTDFGDFTLFGSASNAVSTSLRLGALVDAEFSATTNAAATGDDITGSDDEDGVTVPAMIAGQTLPLPMTVTNLTGSGAFLNVWIDFNNNGILTDSGELVVSNLAVANGSSNAAISPSISVPANAVTGTNLGLRARLVTVSGAVATGILGTPGEIEDYVVTVAAPTTDFGDFQGVASASSTVDSNLKIGTLTDTEYAPTLNAAALGDDATGSDDEDGVTVPAMTAGAPATLPVVVTNTSGSAAYLNVWIDFNNNGSFADSGENVIASLSIASGTNAATQNLDFTVPPTAVTSVNLGLRVRLTSTNNPGATGLSGNGEVEDYITNIATPPLDYGDTNVLANASSTASNALRLGATVDTEYNSTMNSTATGDDITATDDEDGVNIPVMTAGAPGTITVTATNTSGAVAYLNTWIDFNGNGSVSDPGEQIATNVNVADSTNAGSFPINFTVPAAAVTGTTIVVRVRLTSTLSPGITGLSGIGEVEDYVTTLAVPVTDFGDWIGLADASSLQSSNLRMGPLADTEYVSTRNAAASGDDATASDDEDGVTLAAGYNLGAASSLTVTVTNQSGANAYLNGWVDFNNDNDVLDAGEQIAADVLIATGTNGSARTVNFTVPAAAIPGLRGARFRLTSTSTPGISGASGMGEVEDHLITIYCPTIAVTPSSLPTATVGTAYSQTMSASGGTGPYTWSVSSGALPAWATLNTATGTISGMPTNTTTASFTLRATDANTCVGSRSFSMTPVCPVISITPAAPDQMYRNTAYTQTFAASGGTGPYTWSVSSGALPAGLTLNATTAVVSGTPTTLGSSSFTLRAQDSYGCAGTLAYTVQVRVLTIGNLVWQDSDNDGVVDAGEPGVTGATVQLFRPGADNTVNTGDDVQVGSSITTPASGAYSFTDLLPGTYFVKVTPPAGFENTSGTPDTADNADDNDNNGAQPGGSGTALFSPIVTLALGTESTTDGDTNPDTNFTVDFGLHALMSVGNLVYVDVNADGNFDLNEGWENVLVQIFPQGAAVTSTPAGAAVSDHNGRYLITGLNPGSYFLHIPANQFATGEALASTRPMANVVAGDDDSGQDLLAAATPTTTGASTAVFILTPGSEPAGTAESGFEGFVDDDTDSNSDMTLDLGVISTNGSGFPLAQRERQGGMSGSSSSSSAPATYATWTAAHTGADDQDLYPALLEYALDTDPADGRSGSGSVRIETTAAGHADVLFTRPATGRTDIRHELERSLDGVEWGTVTLTPAMSIGSDGRQIVRYAAVDEGVLQSRAQFRLKVMLDANLDGAAEATAVSPAVMYSRETFPVGQRSFSMPLVKAELYAGTVTVSDAGITLPKAVTLPASTELYVEDLATGLGYEVDETTSTSTSIVTKTSVPAGLVRAAVRAHHTVSQLFPADVFTSGTAEAADRLLSFDSTTNAFAPNHLTNSGWTQDTTLPKAGALLMHVRNHEVSLLLTGQVGVKVLAKPSTGTVFISSTSAGVESPQSLGLTTDRGFRAGSRPANATRLRLWKPDADMTQAGYDSLYLTPTQWQRQDDATMRNLTSEKLLEPFRAFFIVP